MTFEESVEACEKCESINFMCPEHRALSRQLENEQAAIWQTDAGHPIDGRST